MKRRTAGLRVMVGLPWTQHVAFLDDRSLADSIRRDVASQVRALGDHPAVLMFALGNEVPPSVVRWHGQERVERFLRTLCEDARDAAPEALFTYVNYPPTSYLDLSSFDVCSFNVYLHRETAAARLPGEPAEPRRAEAAAAGRSRRRQHSRGPRRSGGDHEHAHSRGLRRGRMWRGGVRVDRRMVARRQRDRGLEVRSRRSRPSAETRACRGRTDVCGRAVQRRRARHMAAGLGGRLRLQRRRHDRRMPDVARRARLPRLRSHRRQRRIDRIAPERSPMRGPARAGSP